MGLNDMVARILFLSMLAGCSSQKLMKTDYISPSYGCDSLMSKSRLPDSLHHWIKDDCYHFNDTVIHMIDGKCIEAVKDSVKKESGDYFKGWK